MLVQISLCNRGKKAASLHVLPTLWFRNTWSWPGGGSKPVLRSVKGAKRSVIHAHHTDPLFQESLTDSYLYCEDTVPLLFTENETNHARLFGAANRSPYVKDGINNYVVQGQKDAVNPDGVGTKVSPHYQLTVGPGATQVVRLRLSQTAPGELRDPFGKFDAVVGARQKEADEFYDAITPPAVKADRDRATVLRQALAGMLWSKQYYYFDADQWLTEHHAHPLHREDRHASRNREWFHMVNDDIISMPDKWEYPWYAAWDLAFHTIALSAVDPDFAKQQLDLILQEFFLHPTGQIPAYEWNFSDVNPPVHAWATIFLYRTEQALKGEGDLEFLKRSFAKLMLNFSWWVNRKDRFGKNLFEGGFLGLDNIGVFDRSAALPTGGHLEQSDGTSWMGMYCLNMLAIALELARDDPAYEDVASKFFEHFVYIAHAMHDLGGEGLSLWDEQDGFFYDVLHTDGQHARIKVRSLVGLIPLLAVQAIEPEIVDKLPGFKRRMQWFIDNHPELSEHVEEMTQPNGCVRRLLSIVSREQLPRVLRIMLDEAEFLGPHGIRAVSRCHRDHPYMLRIDGMEHRIDYEPAESSSGLFGGNSNWRGPIWFPVNYLLIEALQKFHHFYGDALKVACPAGAGPMLNLWSVAGEISRRLTRIFLRDEDGRRPVYGGTEKFQRDPHWRDLMLFYEYFHGDNGAGIGASHQTGWTGLVAKLLQQSGER